MSIKINYIYIIIYIKIMNYENLYKHYENCFEKHGDNHLGVDWPNINDVYKRYDVMLNIINKTNKTVKLLDFGCGCGHLLEYINKKSLNIKYYGLDISEKFYNHCKNKFKENTFYNLDILKSNIDILPNFDYIILNGVFTEKRNLENNEMFKFMTSILKKLFLKTNIGLSFNVMSPIVDFKRDDLYYLSYDELGLFLKKNLSKNFVINNNYQLWEYTTYVYK